MRERKARPKAKKGKRTADDRHAASCHGLGGFVVITIALVAGAAYFRPPKPPPKLARELVVGIVEEHHHVLQYYARGVQTHTLPIDGRATILHLDSHADMGVPQAHLEADGAMERYSAINDFMIMAVLTGVAEHLVFVEPPWSNQFRCCVYEGSATFQFTVGLDENNKVRVASESNMAKRLGHVFWRNGQTRTASKSELTQTRDFRITVVASEHRAMDDILVEAIDATTPLILDIDLDYFATENFGALPLRDELGISDADLMTAYHLAWDFPDLDEAYLRKGDFQARKAQSADGARAQRVIAGGAQGVNLLTPFRDAVARRGTADARALLRAFLEAVPVRDGALRGDEAEVFLEQPFHVPEPRALAAEVDFALDEMLAKRVLPRLQRPVLVNIVRSPGYVPVRYLALLECRTLRALRIMYGAFVVSHEARVDVHRTECEGFRARQVGV